MKDWSLHDIVDEIWTNIHKVTDGWVFWWEDMRKNWGQWMDDLWRVDHFANACVTTTIRQPYRTWAICFWIWVIMKVF